MSARSPPRSTYAAPSTAHDSASSGFFRSHASRSLMSAATSGSEAGDPAPTAARARASGPGSGGP